MTEEKVIESPFTKEKNNIRQSVFWEHYLESVLNGEPNIYQSAIKAGFTEDTAQVITTKKWYKDKVSSIKRKGMLGVAEKNLHDILTMPYLKTKKFKDGTSIQEVDIDALRQVVDVSKFVAKTIGKEEGYSERSEVTGKGGEAPIFMPYELLEKYKLTENKEEK